MIEFKDRNLYGYVVAIGSEMESLNKSHHPVKKNHHLIVYVRF